MSAVAESVPIDRVEPVACCAPLAAPTLSDAEAAATAKLFKALGDPARVRALNLLATSDEPVCVCNLIEPLRLSQPTVSHHMKKLLEAGLVEREQRGKWAYYSLKRDAVEKLALVADLKGDADEHDDRRPARAGPPALRRVGARSDRGNREPRLRWRFLLRR